MCPFSNWRHGRWIGLLLYVQRMVDFPIGVRSNAHIVLCACWGRSTLQYFRIYARVYLCFTSSSIRSNHSLSVFVCEGEPHHLSATGAKYNSPIFFFSSYFFFFNRFYPLWCIGFGQRSDSNGSNRLHSNQYRKNCVRCRRQKAHDPKSIPSILNTA